MKVFYTNAFLHLKFVTITMNKGQIAMPVFVGLGPYCKGWEAGRGYGNEATYKPQRTKVHTLLYVSPHL